MAYHKNILLTGIPRSGTTLVTATIHGIPNCVALGEPAQLKTLLEAAVSPEDYACRVQAFMQTTRADIVAGKAIPLNVDRETSAVTTNYFRRIAGGAAQAEQTYEVREEVMPIQDENFVLCLKNNAQFTSCLESLSRLPEVAIVAVVRNPVACLLSWRSLNIPVSAGRLPAGERFARSLRKIRRLEDTLLAQVKILDWFCETFYRMRDRIRLIRYEQFVDNPEILRKIVPVPEGHVFPRHQSMNRRPEYDLQQEEMIRDYLRRHAQFVSYFYPSCAALEAEPDVNPST